MRHAETQTPTIRTIAEDALRAKAAKVEGRASYQTKAEARV